MPRIDLPEGTSDPEVRMWKLRPEMGMGAGALSHAVYEQSIVPVRERELARMRIAEINDCAICQQWRKTTGSAEALDEDDYAHVSDWRAYAGYSEREKLAIEYAERFAADHRNIDDELFTRLRAHFADDEILDLTLCCAVFVGLGRTLEVLQITDNCPIDL